MRCRHVSRGLVAPGSTVVCRAASPPRGGFFSAKTAANLLRRRARPVRRHAWPDGHISLPLVSKTRVHGSRMRFVYSLWRLWPSSWPQRAKASPSSRRTSAAGSAGQESRLGGLDSTKHPNCSSPLLRHRPLNPHLHTGDEMVSY